jgi:hypothetical protein
MAMAWWGAALGGGAFVLASLVVSARLLYLASRTRELPELLIGGNLLLMGGIGYPIAMLARSAADPSVQSGLCAAHGFTTILGQTSIVLFNWLVFRPDDPRLRRLAAGFFALLVALFCWQTVSPGWAGYAARLAGPWRVVAYTSPFVLGWAGLESLLFHAKLRRRLSLGLADPVTTDRLRLWAIAQLSAFAISSTSLALRELGIPLTPVLSAIVVGPLGILAATAMWLAFLPPRRYVSWVAMRIAPQQA